MRAAAIETTTAGSSLGVGRVDASLAGGELGICLAVTVAGVVWRTCAGALIGRFVATGSGFDQPATTSLPWFAATARVDALVHVSGALSLAAFAEQLFPLPQPPELDVQRGAEVIASTTLPSAGLAIGLGPVLRFE
jgi:hypothetical protein